MTLTSDVVGQFAELFQGRYDAYGEEHGGCRRLQGDIGPRSHEGFMDAHLQGARPIGVYPMVLQTKGVAKLTHTEWHPQWIVHWGCIDLDEGEEESWVHAKNVHLALETVGIVGWIERSRSKGYHVWVFADDWVPAGLMRKALLAACQIVDAPTKEINPKQEKLNEGQLGNYVRIMYPGGLRATNDARGLGLAGGPDRGRREFLHQQAPESPSGLHSLLPADDGPGCSGASQSTDWLWRCGDCGQAVFETSPTRGQDGRILQRYVPLEDSGRGSSSRSDVGGVPLAGPPTPGEGARVPRRVAIDSTTQAPICLSCFVSRAYNSRVGRAGLENLAEAYRPPERPIQRRDWTGLPRTADGIDGFAKWVAKQEEGNRNMGLYWAACECLDQGIENLDDLIEAGVMSGLSEAEARRTVESAQRH